MIHIGLSGYSYKPWQGEGRFYPADLKAKDFFQFYSQRYRAVEMDGTWYRMPSTDMVAKWAAVEGEFVFCPKMHRDVTHRARMKESGNDAAKFFLGRLRPGLEAGKVGPVLVQLPPNLKADLPRMQAFLEMLPRQTSALACEGGDAAIRYAVEYRNETWHTNEVEELLREHGVAWVASDTDDADAQRRDTAPHAYIRLRKTEYDEQALSEWAAYFRKLREGGKEVFVFCKHEDEGSPWIWADRLLELTK